MPIEDFFTKDLNVYTFLVYGLVLSFCFLFMFFYFNRLLGLLLSSILGIFIPQFIFIESVKFALLSGSLILKNVTITSTGYRISVHKMSINLRYWLRNVQHVESLPITIKNKYLNWFIHVIKEEKNINTSLPCRVSIKMKGLETFIYNNTALYDSIRKSTQSKSTLSHESTIDSQYDPTFLLWILPISIQITKFSVMIGNKTTKHLISCYFQSAKSFISFKSSNGGNFAQIIQFNALKTQIKLIPNIDTELQGREQSQGTININNTTRGLNKILKNISRKVSLNSNYYDNLEPKEELEWHGLNRYALSNQESIREYAAVYDLIKLEAMDFTYTFDVIYGKFTTENQMDIIKDIISIDLYKPIIQYGPFVERERKKILKRFFAQFNGELPLYNNDIGSSKVPFYTEIAIKTVEAVDFRFPFRNFTHDFIQSSQFDKLFPYSWFDIKTDSEINILMDFYHFKSPTKDFKVDIFLPDCIIKTSLNHELFISFQNSVIKYHSSYGTPSLNKIELTFGSLNGFLLGDHIYMLLDAFTDYLMTDDIYLFNPSKYIISLQIIDAQLLLNANDFGIIENHNSIHDSSHLQLILDQLHLEFNMSFESELEDCSLYFFLGSCNEIKLNPLFSESNTYHNGIEYLLLKSIVIDGTICLTMENNVIDIQMHSKNGQLNLFGHFIRYLGNTIANTSSLSVTVQQFLDKQLKTLVSLKKTLISFSMSIATGELRLPYEWDILSNPSYLSIAIPLIQINASVSEFIHFSISASKGDIASTELTRFNYNFNGNLCIHSLSLNIKGSIEYEMLLHFVKWFLIFKHQIDDFENNYSQTSGSNSFFMSIGSCNLDVVIDEANIVSIVFNHLAQSIHGTLIPQVKVNSPFLTLITSGFLIAHTPALIYYSIPQLTSNAISSTEIYLNLPTLIPLIDKLTLNIQNLFLIHLYTKHCLDFFHVSLESPPFVFICEELHFEVDAFDFKVKGVINNLSNTKCESLSAAIISDLAYDQINATNLSTSQCDLLIITIDQSHFNLNFKPLLKLAEKIKSIGKGFYVNFNKIHELPTIPMIVDTQIVRVATMLMQFRSQLIHQQVLYALSTNTLIKDEKLSKFEFELYLGQFFINNRKTVLHSCQITSLYIFHNLITAITLNEMNLAINLNEFLSFINQFKPSTSTSLIQPVVQCGHIQLHIEPYTIALHSLLYSTFCTIQLVQVSKQFECINVSQILLYPSMTSIQQINIASIQVLKDLHLFYIKNIKDTFKLNTIDSQESSFYPKYICYINQLTINALSIHSILINNNLFFLKDIKYTDSIYSIEAKASIAYTSTLYIQSTIDLDSSKSITHLIQFFVPIANNYLAKPSTNAKLPLLGGKIIATTSFSDLKLESTISLGTSIQLNLNASLLNTTLVFDGYFNLESNLVHISSVDLYIQLVDIYSLLSYVNTIRNQLTLSPSTSNPFLLDFHHIIVKLKVKDSIIMSHITHMTEMGIEQMTMGEMSTKHSLYTKQFLFIKNGYIDAIELIELELDRSKLDLIQHVYSTLPLSTNTNKSSLPNQNVKIINFSLNYEDKEGERSFIKALNIVYGNQISIQSINGENISILYWLLYLKQLPLSNKSTTNANDLNVVIESTELELVYAKRNYLIKAKNVSLKEIEQFSLEIDKSKLTLNRCSLHCIESVSGVIDLSIGIELMKEWMSIYASFGSKSSGSAIQLPSIELIDLDVLLDSVFNGHVKVFELTKNSFKMMEIENKLRNPMILILENYNDYSIDKIELKSSFQLEIVLLLQILNAKLILNKDSTNLIRDISFSCSKLIGRSSSVLIPSAYALYQLVKQIQLPYDYNASSSSLNYSYNFYLNVNEFEFIFGSSTLSNKEVMTVILEKLDYTQSFKDLVYISNLRINSVQLLKSNLSDSFLIEPFSNKFSSKLLANIPNLSIYCELTINESEIVYSFDFESNIIDVTLQIKNYQFIQDITSLYIKEASRYGTSPILKYTYIANRMKIDPKLKITGEATPSLSFLGIEKTELPKVYIERIILPIHGALK